MPQDDKDVLERSSTKTPDLKLITKELGYAQADFGTYCGNVARARQWWQCEWDDQWVDGRKHPTVKGRDCYPWPGASDCRPSVVSGIVKEHVTLDLVAFWSAKVQCKSNRPFVQGEQSNIATEMLQWRVYTHMKRELLWELPLALTWKRAIGLSFIGIEWEQVRDIVEVPITLDDLAQISAQLGLGDLVGMILDPDKAYDDQLVDALTQILPVLPKGDARKILDSLRNTGQALVPVAMLRVNQPVWTALRAGIDILFPSETADIQRARWVAKRELVDESTLVDRIVTDGYDDAFVDKALTKKGEFASWMPGYVARPMGTEGSDRDMIELFHVLNYVVDNGVPSLYKTVFNDASIGNDNLYAVYRKFEYDHQQYPLVALRNSFNFRPLLSSIGIAEESYTEENDIKWQQDLLNNHADIVLQPPMVVSTD